MKTPRSRRLLEWLWAGHRFWWRVSGGRVGGKAAGLPVLELITMGRRSGEPRSVLLNFVKHPDGFVVAASNAGGAAPAWWRNLEAGPHAEVRAEGRRERITAERLDGEARSAAWTSFVAANPEYARYRTEAGREIPVVLLRRDVTTSSA